MTDSPGHLQLPSMTKQKSDCRKKMEVGIGSRASSIFTEACTDCTSALMIMTAASSR